MLGRLLNPEWSQVTKTRGLRHALFSIMILLTVVVTVNLILASVGVPFLLTLVSAFATSWYGIAPMMRLTAPLFRSSVKNDRRYFE